MVKVSWLKRYANSGDSSIVGHSFYVPGKLVIDFSKTGEVESYTVRGDDRHLNRIGSCAKAVLFDVRQEIYEVVQSFELHDIFVDRFVQDVERFKRIASDLRNPAEHFRILGKTGKPPGAD